MHSTVSMIDIVNAARERGQLFQLSFDPCVPGVQVPGFLRNKRQCVLSFFSHDHYEDFKLDEDGIGAELYFNGVAHDCYVPWSAATSYCLLGEPRPQKKQKPKLRLIQGGLSCV